MDYFSGSTHMQTLVNLGTKRFLSQKVYRLVTVGVHSLKTLVLGGTDRLLPLGAKRQGPFSSDSYI